MIFGRQNFNTKSRLLVAAHKQAQEKPAAPRTKTNHLQNANVALSLDPEKSIIENITRVQGYFSQDVVRDVVNDVVNICRTDVLESVKGSGRDNNLSFVTHLFLGVRLVTESPGKDKDRTEIEQPEHWSFVKCEECAKKRLVTLSQSNSCGSFAAKGRIVGDDEYCARIDFMRTGGLCATHLRALGDSRPNLAIHVAVEYRPATLQSLACTDIIKIPNYTAEDIGDAAKRATTLLCDSCNMQLRRLLEFSLWITMLSVRKVMLQGQALGTWLEDYINRASGFWLGVVSKYSNMPPDKVGVDSVALLGDLSSLPKIAARELPPSLRGIAQLLVLSSGEYRQRYVIKDGDQTSDHSSVPIDFIVVLKNTVEKHRFLHRVLVAFPKNTIDLYTHPDRFWIYFAHDYAEIDNNEELSCRKKDLLKDPSLRPLQMLHEQLGLISRRVSDSRLATLLESNIRPNIVHLDTEAEKKCLQEMAAMVRQRQIAAIKAVIEHGEVPQEVKRYLITRRQEDAETIKYIAGATDSEYLGEPWAPILLKGPNDFGAILLLHRTSGVSSNVLQATFFARLLDDKYTDLELIVWRAHKQARIIYYDLNRRTILGGSTEEVLINLGFPSGLSEDQILQNWQKLWRAAKPLSSSS